MWKKHDIILLPKKEKTNLLLIKSWNLLYKTDVPAFENIFPAQLGDDESFQSLYILSDERIKANDWFYHGNHGIHQCKRIERDIIISETAGLCNRSACKKVIATTDLLYIYDESKFIKNSPTTISVPHIPNDFVEYYISCFNKHNVIFEVMLEYVVRQNWVHSHSGDMILEDYSILSLDSGTTINVKECKRNYTYEEIMNAIHQVELKHNKNYSKLWEEIKTYL